MRNTEKYLRLLLRIVGASAILAIVAVIMPHSWLVYWVNLAEPGTSVRVLIPYLARLLSAYYVLCAGHPNGRVLVPVDRRSIYYLLGCGSTAVAVDWVCLVHTQ